MTTALFLLGVALAVAGVALVFAPAALVLAGVALAALAWRIEVDRAREALRARTTYSRDEFGAGA